MPTPLPSFLRHTLATIAVLLGSSAIAPAAARAAAPPAPVLAVEPPAAPPAAAPAAPADAAPPASPPAAPPTAAPAAPQAVPAVDLMPPQAAAATTPAGPTQVIGAGTSAPVVVEPPATEPASIDEVGIRRVPAYSYPEDPDQPRGIRHGSLWLTFHGKQWPYMPTFTGDKRFVIGVSGWGWIDNSYQKFSPWGLNPNIEQDRVRYWRAQARMLLRITPTYALSGGHFIQGQVELVGTGDQTLLRTNIGGQDTDDLWLRVGKWNKWDLMAGRFEGWEVFHLGMGLDFNTFERTGAVGPGESGNQIAFYGLTDNQFRPAGAAGNVAVHYYPLKTLRFELLGLSGAFSGPVYGTRPVAILDLGWLKLKGGVEYQKLLAFNPNSDKTDVTSKGVGGAIQFVIMPRFEFGLNAAQGTVWAIDNRGGISPTGSYTRTSLGAFANLSNGSVRHPVIFGVGSLMTWTENQNGIQPNPVDSYWLYQGFVAAQYVVQGTLYIKLVGGYSRGHWSLAGDDPRIEFYNEVYSARLRFSLYF